MIKESIKNNWRLFIFLLLLLLLLLIFFVKKQEPFKKISTCNNVSSEKAIDIVEGQLEVKNFLKPGKKITDTQVSTPIVGIDHETDSSWEVHVYSIEEYLKDKEFPSHTATFNWYSIDKCTGEIKCSFFIYKNGKFDKASPQYPCVNSGTTKKSTIETKEIIPSTFGIKEDRIVDPQYKGTPRIQLFNENGNTTSVMDNEYFTLLKNKILNDKLGASAWFENKCNEFWLMNNKDGKYFTIERHGYHQDGCPGDSSSSPRYEVFQIDKKTKEILFDDYISGKILTFDEWSKTTTKQ